MSSPDPFDFGRATPPPPGYNDPGYGSSYGNPGPGGQTYGGQTYGGGPVGTPDARPSGPGVADDLVGRPPMLWLLGALGLGVVAAVLAAVVGEDVTMAGLAWLLAGPVGIALVAVYSRRDTAARARPIYDAPATLSLLRWATGLALAAGIVVSALRIAEWAGRL